MPVLPDYMENSIGILYNHDSKTNVKNVIGTAFLVSSKKELGEDLKTYLVTCNHCTELATSVIFRYGYEIELTEKDWAWSELEYDLDVIDITSRLPEAMKGKEFIDRGIFIDKNDLRFGVGSEIFMLGLHQVEYDRSNPNPRAKFGYISGWAKDQELIRQGNNAKHPSHIGDMRSRSGFSGSPVFAWREVSGLNGYTAFVFHFIGVHSAQFPDRIDIFTKNGQYKAEIPSSMTVIVPSWSLVEYLDNAY